MVNPLNVICPGCNETITIVSETLMFYLLNKNATIGGTTVFLANHGALYCFGDFPIEAWRRNIVEVVKW